MKNDVMKLFSLMFAFYQKEVQTQVLAMYAHDLREFSYEEIERAFEIYRDDPANKFPPMPAALKKILRPQIDPHSIANDVASKVHGAVSKFGWNQPQAARAHIGEIGWEVVREYGGWEYICQHLGLALDIGTFRAQVRETVKARVTISYQAAPAVHPALTSNPTPRLEGST